MEDKIVKIIYVCCDCETEYTEDPGTCNQCGSLCFTTETRNIEEECIFCGKESSGFCRYCGKWCCSNCDPCDCDESKEVRTNGKL